MQAIRTPDKTTVLVADDDAGVLAFVCRLLEGDGHAVIRAHDGSVALAPARDLGQSIRVLVTDIRMPGIGGRELAHEEAVPGRGPQCRPEPPLQAASRLGARGTRSINRLRPRGAGGFACH